jgi:hypothetical protein
MSPPTNSEIQMKNSRHLPFIPYSNSGLREGDFWILTLEDRSFSAGRVLRPSLNLSRTKFVGGEWDILLVNVFHVKTITKSGGVVGNFELTPTECLLAKNDDFVASNRRHVVRRSPLTHTGRGLSIFSPWAVTRSGSLPTITSSTIGLTLRRIPDSRSSRESVYLFLRGRPVS